jgi:hypothetical protein
MQVIQVQFTVNGVAYQVVGVADAAETVVAALKAQAGDAVLSDVGPEVLWDSDKGFTYAATQPLLTCAKDGADAGWLKALIAGTV